MFRTKEKLTAILVAIVTFVTALLLGFATLLGIPQKVSTAKAESTTQYVKVTSAPTDWSGEYLIVYESGTEAYIFNAVDAANGYVSATISNGTIEGSATIDAEVVTIATMSGGYSIQSKNGYIYGSSSGNKLSFNKTTAQLNKITLGSNSTVDILNGRYLRFNATSGQYRFRYYSQGTQQPICLYKKETVTTCEHANKVLQPVTDTETHIYFCNDCEQTVGEAIDCTWDEGVVTTPATNTTDGVMTYTCTCGNTKEEIIPKLDAVIYTITYSTPNGINAPDADEIAEGLTATLPTANAPDGYVFVGWTTNQAATNEEGVCLAGSEYTVTENVTLYALYKTDVKAGGWYLVENEDSLEIGEKYTIVAGNNVIGAFAGTSKNYFYNVAIEKDTNAGTFTCSSEFTQYILEQGISTNTYSFKNVNDNTYLLAVKGSNQLKTSTEKTDLSSWTISINGNDTTITEAADNGEIRRLQYNSSSPRFACYTSSQTAVSLYKYVAGEEPIYSTNPCNHEGATSEETTPATCTTAGEKTYTCTCGKTWTEEIPATGHTETSVTLPATCTEAETTVVSCSVCEEELSRTANGEALGHNWNEGEITKEPTATETGIRLYTCQRENCGETYEEILPTTTLYTVIFSVLGNTEAVESENVGAGAAITLPTPDGLPMGVSFVGWTNEPVDNAEEINSENVFVDSYTVTADETLYALIAYASGEAVTLYEKVTEAPADWSGEYLIVYEGSNVAFNGGLTTLDAVSNTISVDITDGAIEATDTTNAAAFTIAKSGTSYTIKSASGYYIGKTASGNGLNTNQSTQYTNTLSVAGGDVTITASGGSILRFNDASNQMRFRYYGSGQQAIQLYKFVTKQNFTYTTTLTAKFNSASLTIGTDLTMNYYATVDAAYTNLKAQFTIAGDVIEVDGEYDSTENRYVFSFALPPQCMADNISAVLLSGETEIAWVNNYSVRTYAINNLNKTTSNELKALLYELLRYGAAAQQYTGYNTGDLATAGVSLPEAADVNATDNYKLTNHIENGTADDYTVYITAVGVRFENVNKIYVKFNATAENVSVRISRGGVEVGTFALNDTILYTNEIYATAFDDVFTFEVFVGETNTQTLTYSVNSYVANRVAAGSSDAMTDLAKALYLYGEAAKAYAPLAN